MPKATYIVQRRTRRQQRKNAANNRLLRLGLLLVLLPGLFLFAALLGGVTVATAVTAALSHDLPAYDILVQQQIESVANGSPATVYASGSENVAGQPGQILIHQINDPAATTAPWTTLDQMPSFVVDAVVAANEPSFWEETGFITRSREALALLAGAAQPSGSIVQQLAQTHFVAAGTLQSGPRSLAGFRRTVEQLLLIRQIESAYTKEQILEWYLNTSYYGNLAIGIEAASQIYFDKSAAGLTLGEATLLAAVPRQTAVNPRDDYTAAAAQQTAVLAAMARLEMISPETAVAASQLPTAVAPRANVQPDTIAPHFALAVEEELVRRFGPEQVLRGGLRVTTTLDLALQQQAECVMRAQLNRLGGQSGPALPADELARCPALAYLLASGEDSRSAGDHNAAIVLLDSQTGQIKALAGSHSFWNEAPGTPDQTVTQQHPPGTALHPLIYLTALSQGFSAATMVLDVETDFGEQAPFVPQNRNGRFHGPMRLRDAAGSNFVVPAVQVLSWVGTNKLIDAAHSMGITSLTRGAHPLSDPLNGEGVSLLDMAVVFGVMNNMGVMAGQPRPEAAQQPDLRALDPVTILRVEDGSGALLYEYTQPERREILTPQLAFLMNHILSDRSARCAGYGCPNVLELPDNRPAAVVAGDSSDLAHAWTIGYTPQLVAGVWVGSVGGRTVTGETAAAPIWRALMAWAHENEPVITWERPSTLIERAVCDISGLLPTPVCPTVTELFIPGTEPTLPDTMFREVAVNRETGRLATVYTPPELVENRAYIFYPEAAQSWARQNDIPQPPTEYDSIRANSAASGSVAITAPAPFAAVRGRVTISGTVRSDDVAFYRLAYFAGLQPVNIQTIADNVTEPPEDGVLGVWDTTNLDGLFTLLLTVVGTDGRFQEVTTHVTVDNTPPQIVIVSPLPDAQITAAEPWVTVQAQASDNVAVAEVAFYANDAAEPFAVSGDGRFTARWPMPAPGCYDMRAVAGDLAGNESETAVTVCVTAPE